MRSKQFAKPLAAAELGLSTISVQHATAARLETQSRRILSNCNCQSPLQLPVSIEVSERTSRIAEPFFQSSDVEMRICQ